MLWQIYAACCTDHLLGDTDWNSGSVPHLHEQSAKQTAIRAFVPDQTWTTQESSWEASLEPTTIFQSMPEPVLSPQIWRRLGA